ncbi:MAG: T9SS type A sorting domain-containing protein [Bacteroidetes bacterium]|jgi:photosystem II stability/assembly factor-like uncharacterized protein|nr:T9SS type A sorting domain-containing protein [Bacteroidota bacterium]MBT6686896.1 T9SS type A sorting domain-containing protein [Bacteroidota bacterium]MBT7144206.1 T9SS type A sorting domain-containing protein [Bacteroidota bacterium]MBT7491589.1 T9SS type A sorting domain-containing protein [Bacteroidota bacterium]
MKKITICLTVAVFLITAKISFSQNNWEPVFNFSSPNGSIAVSNTGKIFTYQAYHFLNSTYYEAMLSIDNGSTWTQVNDEKFATAFFNNQEDLYAIRQDNFPGTSLYFPQSTFLTADDGSSWTTIDTVADNMGQVNASVFRMDNSGTLYTAFRGFSENTGGFKYSTDDGASWTLIPTFISGPFDYNDIYSALLTSNGDFFITTYNQGVFKSSDAGENWTRVYESFVTLGYLNEHPTTGDLYVASLGAILKSTDNGENWEELVPDPWMAMNIMEFEITSDGTFWFANSGGFFKSDDCIHWESVWSPNKNGSRASSLLDMAISDNYIYVSGNDSTVYRKTRENVSSISDLAGKSPLSIYPNPANDFVTIKLYNSESDKMKNELSITDINGRLVYQDILPQGSLSFKICTTKLESGFYIVTIVLGTKNFKEKLIIRK